MVKSLVTEIKCIISIFCLHTSCTKISSCIKLFLAPKYLCFFSSLFNLYIFSTMGPPLFPKLDNSSGKSMISISVDFSTDFLQEEGGNAIVNDRNMIGSGRKYNCVNDRNIIGKREEIQISPIGRGKMMVEFFSAAIPLRVWRYLQNFEKFNPMKILVTLLN